MADYLYPVATTVYRSYTIRVYVWDQSGMFYGGFDFEEEDHAGFAPGRYETIDAVIDACKELIDFPYGR